jgi:hypothetical protein
MSDIPFKGKHEPEAEALTTPQEPPEENTIPSVPEVLTDPISAEVSFMRDWLRRSYNLVRDPKTKLTGPARLTAEQIARYGKILRPKKYYDQIFTWQKGWAGLQKTIDTHTDLDAYNAFDKQQRNLHGRVNESDHITGEILSREDWERKFERVRESALVAQEELYLKNLDCARVFADAAAQILRDHAIELEATEKDRFKRYGIHYPGSPLVAAVLNAEKFVRNMVKSNGGNYSPAMCLPWLIL